MVNWLIVYREVITASMWKIPNPRACMNCVGEAQRFKMLEEGGYVITA
jgi:hypothetical protein